MTQPPIPGPHIFTGNDKDTEPLRALPGRTTSKRPTGPRNPAEHPDYYKRLGAENDAAFLKEMRFLTSVAMAVALIMMLWTLIGVVGAFYFYHAITSGHVIPFGG